MRIFLIDNNWTAMRWHTLALRDAGYSIEPRSEVSRVLQGLETENEEDREIPDCVLMDVMMPAPTEWRDESDHGLRTGLVLGYRLREKYAKMPIIFLTNTRDAAVLQEVRGFPGPKQYLDKRETDPDQLVAVVKSFFGSPN